MIVLTCVLFGRTIRDRLLIDRFEQTEQLLSVRARSFATRSSGKRKTGKSRAKNGAALFETNHAV